MRVCPAPTGPRCSGSTRTAPPGASRSRPTARRSPTRWTPSATCRVTKPEPPTRVRLVALPPGRTRASPTLVTPKSSTNSALQCAPDLRIDPAAQDAEAATFKRLRQLAAGIVQPFSQKVNPADQPLIYDAMSWNPLSVPELAEAAERFMGQRLFAL